jgi:hypothetical protein
MNRSEHRPVTITIDREHLDALCQNTEWSLRFAELYEAGDPVEDVPVWTTIAQLRAELELEPLAEEDLPQPQEWVPDFAANADIDVEQNIKLRGERRRFEKLTYKLARTLKISGAAVQLADTPLELLEMVLVRVEGGER